MKITYKIKYALSIAFAIFIYASAIADAKGYYIGGIVRDSLSLEPLPFSSVTVIGEASGTLTNDQGIFQLTVSDNAKEMQVSCLGYEKKIVPIKKGQINLYDVQMAPSTTELKELIVKKPKYKKKGNPAVAFAQKLREQGALYDPERNPFYNYKKHEIITIALNDFVNKDENSWAFKKFPFLWEHVDTSEVSGKPILNVIKKEKISDVHSRNKPRSKKEVVNGLKHEGIDEITDQTSMLTYLNDVLREIDLYDNDITLLQNRFVSPLSRIAPDFYKFYLTDTVEVSGEKCIVLSFYPHNNATFGFTGQAYVPVNDSTMFIKKVTMRTPRNINLNFIENLYISQEYKKAEDGSRLKATDDLTIEIKVAPGTPGFYARRNVAYSDHDFDKLEDLTVFDKLEDVIILPEAGNRDDNFWESSRIANVTDNENRIEDLLTRLRKVPVYYWTEKFLKIMFSGYVNTGNPSKFDYGPVNTTISHGYIEGWRLRVGGMTTANLSKRWFSRGFVAYGTKDHKWKYSAELEYSFKDKEYHSREFPIHSIRATSTYDVDQIGQHYLFTNNDNIFLSLKRMKATQVTYHNVNKIEYTLELPNNFSINAIAQNEIQHATKYMPFVYGNGQQLNNYSETSLKLQLRYAPGEKFYQTKTYRIPVNLDAPVFILSHTYAPSKMFGNRFCINVTEASVSKRVWFSAFGYADLAVKGGHVWSRSPFPNLLIPNANLSYTIQPESFALMNPMEFINDTYGSLFVTYWANGALLNLIPGVKRLKLREVVSFSSLWGHLSDRNNPIFNDDLLKFPIDSHQTNMTGKPYMEISAGLDNIFKCLRVDYVWRLSYLNCPYPIDRHGLRIAVHVTF